MSYHIRPDGRDRGILLGKRDGSMHTAGLPLRTSAKGAEVTPLWHRSGTGQAGEDRAMPEPGRVVDLLCFLLLLQQTVEPVAELP